MCLRWGLTRNLSMKARLIHGLWVLLPLLLRLALALALLLAPDLIRVPDAVWRRQFRDEVREPLSRRFVDRLSRRVQTDNFSVACCAVPGRLSARPPGRPPGLPKDHSPHIRMPFTVTGCNKRRNMHTSRARNVVELADVRPDDGQLLGQHALSSERCSPTCGWAASQHQLRLRRSGLRDDRLQQGRREGGDEGRWNGRKRG